MSDRRNLTWIAPQHGQRWRDEYSLSAADWLSSLVPKTEWERRTEKVNDFFQSAKTEWAQGRRQPVYDPTDLIAWYIYLARCYGDPDLRPDFFEPEGYRIAPVFRRIGQILPELKLIGGAEERAARLMTDGRKQPDDGLYELLVAAAYKRRGWLNVEFVPEKRGIAKQPDIFVDRGRSHWAVECKRAGRSRYAQEERNAGERMAARVHELSRTSNRPISIISSFSSELSALPDSYLEDKARVFIEKGNAYNWSDQGGSGRICGVYWDNLRTVLRHDDILFGSSRFLELVMGKYVPWLDFSIKGDWTPADGRPFHAKSVEHISVVAWVSASEQAARRKAQHFRSIVGGASKQLPGDRPGVVHVGYEAAGGNSADGLRHRLNREQMRTFDDQESRIRWVYGNYFMPERTTARMESAAVSETMAWYRVAGTRTRQPLAAHLLFMDEDGRPGAHFYR